MCVYVCVCLSLCVYICLCVCVCIYIRVFGRPGFNPRLIHTKDSRYSTRCCLVLESKDQGQVYQAREWISTLPNSLVL